MKSLEMRLDNLKPAINNKPFIKTPNFEVTMVERDNKITEFKVQSNNVQKVFKVKGENILSTWKLVEKYLEKLIV